jgi:ring-1,2-phenylacetyl-CoA epoxidase subunit PaaC
MATDARLSLLLALADDEFVLGHRLGEWTGWVPYVEEDLALSSIAQDEIGHARALYEIASVIDGRNPDELALGRRPDEYRNAILCERPNRDFAYTIARQWLYDTADDVRLRALASSSFTELREVVAVLQLEERYHVEHAVAWIARLAKGPIEARRKLTNALEETISEAFGIFEPFEDEEALLASGVLMQPNPVQQQEWLEIVSTSLEKVGLEQVLGPHIGTPSNEMVPTSAGAIEEERETHPSKGLGGRRGKHSEDFLPMWEEMTALYRAHPGARW